MRKLLITLSLLFIGFISFTQAQFVSNIYYPAGDLPTSLTNTVFSNDIVVCKSDGGVNGQFYSQVRFSAYYANGLGCANSYAVSLSPNDYVDLKQAIYSKKPAVCDGRIEILNTSQGLVCSITSSKMPVSEFAPVINGLESVVNEFIPYVLYIGIGLISAVIGFVAVRRLINRVRGKSLGVFRSKKK